jgi:hypothetical protein
MDGGERKKSGDWLILLLIAGVLAIPLGVGYVVYKIMTTSPAAPPPLPALPSATTAPAAAPTATPTVSRTPLPELDASDAFVRKLVQALSANPAWATWLATEGLVRRFVVVVDNLAEGRSPTKHLSVLAPKERFATVERGKAVFVDPKSYKRYDLAADVVASLDVKGTAQAYRQLKPLIDKAYKELGYPDRNFDATLAKAIDRLLATPVPRETVELKSAVKSYRYADPALESLTPAQKQLLRLGPENMKKVQEKLRELRKALALPE